MKNIVEVRNLSIDFKIRNGLFRAVDEISFDIETNKTLALVGESGSGKSTIAKVLSGLQDFDGVIRFSNKNFVSRSKIDRNYRRNVQIVFQHPDASLNPRQRVHEILSRPLKLYDIVPLEKRAGRVEELLEKVRLPV